MTDKSNKEERKMKSVPKKLEDKATIAQVKQLQEVRDCPDPSCSGILDRVDVWEHDGSVLEKYAHKSDSSDHDGCECDSGSEDSPGLLRRLVTSDPIAVHQKDGKSSGRGCLRGEF